MLERIADALGIDTPELFNTTTVIFLPTHNKSIERLYQDIMDEFDEFRKTIGDKFKKLQ